MKAHGSGWNIAEGARKGRRSPLARARAWNAPTLQPASNLSRLHVVRGVAIPASSATTSACRAHPVFSSTPRTWLRTVLSDTPPDVAITSTVSPPARLRATFASAGVRSKSDRMSSTDGAPGAPTGARIRTAAQRTKMSRADRRIGTTCATRKARPSVSRSGKDWAGGASKRGNASIMPRKTVSAALSLRVGLEMISFWLKRLRCAA